MYRVVAIEAHKHDVIRVERNQRVVDIIIGQLGFVVSDAIVTLDDCLAASLTNNIPVRVGPLDFERIDQLPPRLACVKPIEGYHFAAVTIAAAPQV